MQLCNEMRESWTLCLVGVMISEISGRFWSQSKQRYLCLEHNRQILRFDMFGNAPDTKPSQKFVQTGAKTVFEHENLTHVYPCARFPDTWAHISTLTVVTFSWKLPVAAAVWGRSDTAGLQQHEADAEVIQTPVRNCKVISSNKIR